MKADTDMPEIEFYPLRIYVRKDGWCVTVVEVQNFDNGANWALFTFQGERPVHVLIGIALIGAIALIGTAALAIAWMA